MAITLRTDKGSELSYSELDGNFQDLDFRTAHGWNDLVNPVTTRVGTSEPPLSVLRDGIVGHAFDPNNSQECFTNFHFRHDYVPGTMIYPHVHWATNTTSTGTVRWGIEYTIARRFDSTGQTSFPVTSTLYIEQTITSDSQYLHFVTESPEGFGINGSMIEADTLMLCRFFRDSGHPNDTFPDLAYLLTVDIHYEARTLCTRLRYPPFN